MEIKKIFVAGAGLMGGGIAQVCAQAGYTVTMRDVSDQILEKSLKAISWSVGKFVEKGKVEGSVADIMGRFILRMAGDNEMRLIVVIMLTSGSTVSNATEQTLMTQRKVCPNCVERVLSKSERFGKTDESPISDPVETWAQEI